MSRSCAAGFLLVCLAALFLRPVQAATLERATFDEITDAATDVISGQVLGSHVEKRGESIYTHYSVQVVERWKGAQQLVMDVVLPGGAIDGFRQSFAGVPLLTTGKTYVMFLWAGASGRTQLVGLTQGLFDVLEDAAGDMIAARGVSNELMLDHAGKPVQDQAVAMKLRELSSRVKLSATHGKAAQ